MNFPNVVLTSLSAERNSVNLFNSNMSYKKCQVKRTILGFYLKFLSAAFSNLQKFMMSYVVSGELTDKLDPSL